MLSSAVRRWRLPSWPLSVVADAGPEGHWHKSSKTLTKLDEQHGIGPRYGYPMLTDLVQPWIVRLPLLEGNGNYGSVGNDPPADARYTEGRLSAVGALAVAAERQAGPPVPIALINGTTYRGGLIPPFDPAAVTAALLAGGATDPELVEMVGTPQFLLVARSAGTSPGWRPDERSGCGSLPGSPRVSTGGRRCSI